MANKDVFQRYLDAGISFTNMTRARAEELVQELVQNGEFQRGEARARVEELIERSRSSREAFVSQVRHEVDHQLSALGFTSLEDLARQVASVLQRTAEAGRASTGRTKSTKTGAKPKKAAAKKTPAKKAAAKKASAKKSPAKKAAATKGAATKASARKGGTSPAAHPGAHRGPAA